MLMKPCLLELYQDPEYEGTKIAPNDWEVMPKAIKILNPVKITNKILQTEGEMMSRVLFFLENYKAQVEGVQVTGLNNLKNNILEDSKAVFDPMSMDFDYLVASYLNVNFRT